mgnify:CR=1 FL=1
MPDEPVERPGAMDWLIAVLIAAAWFTHEGMERALRLRIEQDLTGLDGATVHTAAICIGPMRSS